VLAAAALLAAAFVWLALSATVAGRRAVAALEAGRTGAPVEVFAAPTTIRIGGTVQPEAIEQELWALGYRRSEAAPRLPGEYRPWTRGLELFRRPHEGPAGAIPAAFVRIRWSADEHAVWSIEDGEGRRLRAFALEPVRLGAFRGPVFEDRRPVGLDDLPRRLVLAVLAAEDARFLEHPGVDLRAIARAAWVDIRGGGLLQGGSTITQQVIKNRIVGHERTLLRKAREAFLAAWVERRVSKRRLLEIYLNEIYLGQRGPVSVIGMPAAALHYFGRDLRHLELQQMAMLAGLIASPGRYDPRRHPEAAAARTRWVLQRMVATGVISEQEARAAGEAPLGVVDLGPAPDPAGDVLDAVGRELARRGWTPRPGERPVRVATTIETPLQSAARQALRETLERLETERPERAPLEGAVVVLRPATGTLAALVGGRSGLRGGFHRALDARRQPGSAFKPFAVLAAFEDLRWNPSHRVDDSPLTLRAGGRRWSPRNVDGRFRGPVSVREAVEQSLNVPLVRLAQAVGVGRVAGWASRAGLPDDLPVHASLPLGTAEVSPLELATGYGTLAALGQRHAPSLVRGARVVPAGPTLVEPPGLLGQRVASRAASWMVLDTMTGVIERGTARALRDALEGARLGAKTGTSQSGRDGWCVLVTGDAVVVVWVGRDDGRPAALSGPRAALPVIRRMVELAPGALLEPLPAPPPDVSVVWMDPDERCVPDEDRPGLVRAVYRRDEAPPPCRGGIWRWLQRQERRFSGAAAGRPDTALRRDRDEGEVRASGRGRAPGGVDE
jgi:penicillin-binding protein 1B